MKRSSPASSPRIRSLGWPILLAVCQAGFRPVVPCGFSFQRPSTPHPISVASPPLRVFPETVRLGDLHPGRRALATLLLHKPGRLPVTVVWVATSCPCVTVGPRPVRIAAEASSNLSVSYDSTGEPDFRGRLAVSMTGQRSDGATLFRAGVELQGDDRASGRHDPATVDGRRGVGILTASEIVVELRPS